MATYTGDSQPNTLTGTDDDDILFGLGADDTLNGAGGMDTLDGGTGNDKMYGGAGDDIYVVNAVGDQVFENAGEGYDTIQTALATYTLAALGQVEKLVYTGSFGFAGTGNAGDNMLVGGDSGDGLVGGGGSDVLYGGHGDDGLLAGSGPRDDGTEHDQLFGEGGNDHLYIGYGDDADGDRLTDYLYLSLAGAGAGVTLDTTGIVSGGPFVLGGGTIQNMESVATLWGTSFADTLTIATQVGIATVYGEGGNDVLTGGGSSIVFYGGEGNDVVTGGAGGIAFTGGAGTDQFAGGSGDDIVYLSPTTDSGDTIDGGAGTDTVDGSGNLTVMAVTGFEKLIGQFTITMAQANQLTGFNATLQIVDSGVLNLTGIAAAGTLILGNPAGNNITLTNHDIAITGGASGDIITGGSKRLIDGGGGDDTITGGLATQNFARGGAGNDTITGGDIRDFLGGGLGADDVKGGGGDDQIEVYTAADIVAGDKMDGGDGYDLLKWAGPGFVDLSAATLSGFEELVIRSDMPAGVRMTTAQFAQFQRADTPIEFTDGGTVTLAGKAVKGVFKLGPTATVFNATGVQIIARWVNGLDVQGGAGDDTITGFGLLKGGGGSDKLFGGGKLYGEDGNDELHGGAYATELYGGAGDDTYFVVDVANQVFENVGEGTDTISTALSSLTLGANFERLVYTGTGAFAGTGNDLANVIDTRAASGDDILRGLGGADTLYAGVGADSLDGGAGIDTMYGGAGDDTYHVDDAADQAIELSGEGNDTVRSTAASYVLGVNIETLILAGAAKNGTGNALDNVLIGNGGHNILDGGAGADRMEGGAGDDTYYIDNANDLIVETAGLDKAIASVSYTLRAGVSVETLTTSNDAGTGAINLKGNELANRIVGNAGANTLNGGGGNDRLEGLDGSDTLWGDAGNDLLYGGNGNDLYVVTDLGDTIVETATGGTDRVSLSLATGGVFTLANYVETLVVAGAGIEAHGNAQDNRIVNSATGSSIWGEGGNDTLEGGAVAEALHGGIGNDRITGNAGNDTMWGDAGNDLFVFATGSGADEVVDFTRGADKIDLTGYGISSLSQVQGMMSQSGANAVIDLGGGNSITLDNIVGSQLTASDFVFAAAPPAFAVMALAPDVLLASDDCLSGGGAAKAYIFDL